MTPRYLGLALFAEGPTDHRFLQVLLPRVVRRLVASVGEQIVIGDMELLPDPPPTETPDRRADRIALRAYLGAGMFHLLFVHADGAGDEERVRRDQVQPGIEEASTRVGGEHREYVGVVPVREMEAWAIADADAVCRSLQVQRDPGTLGLPATPRDAERVLDPKAALDQAVAAARGGRRSRRRQAGADYLPMIAERVSLDALSQLSAFATLRDETSAALENLGFRGIDWDLAR